MHKGQFAVFLSVLTSALELGLPANRIYLPSVLWRCWLGGRKGIRAVKNWVVGCWRGYMSGARCRLVYSPADAHCHSLSLASVKSRLVLPFWYRLTWVVPDKGPLNMCDPTVGQFCLSHRTKNNTKDNEKLKSRKTRYVQTKRQR